MRKTLLSGTILLTLLAAASIPSAAAAATYTTPPTKTISFTGGTVKGYSLGGSVSARQGEAPSLYVSLTKPHETVSLSSSKNVKLTLAKNLSTGSISADLGKQYGKIAMTFKASAKATSTGPGKGCTGGPTTTRKGALNGTFVTKWNDTYFKTVKKSKLAATASTSPKTTCTYKPPPGGGSSSKTIYLSGNPKGLFVSISKAPNGVVTENVGTAFVQGPGPSISRNIYVTAPASAFTVAANAASAQATGVGQSLGGKLKYAATSFYTGGSSGKLSGDFWVEFVGKGVQRPFAAGNVPGSLSKPGFVPPNQKPTATFTSQQTSGTQDVDFDGSASSDPDGFVSDYAWNFGDGSDVVHGATPTHRYATPGTKSVTLTVTDDKGAKTSITKDVVVAANQLPTAAFTWSEDDPGFDTTVSFDSTDSTDADGTVEEYAWNFGDGTPVSNDAFPSHTYANPGTYSVSLTVTDNGGATNTATHSVTVSPLEP